MPAKVSFNIDLGPDLSNEVMDIARKQGEDPERIRADIQELRDMLFERGLCDPPRTDDDFLLRFLRARFFKMENVYGLLCRYCEFRETNPELHVDVHPFLLTKLGEEDIVSVTPYHDQNGRRIMIYKFGNWRPSKIPVDEILKATLLLFEMGALEPQSQVMGGVGIIDLEGLSLQHIWNLSPSVAKKVISLMVTCMPVRTTAIHIINNNWTFDMVWQVFKPFLSERMRKQVYIHGSDMSSLHQHIDKAHLPIKYGGDMPEFPYIDWMKTLAKNDKVQEELKAIGYQFDADEFSAFI